MLTFSSVRIFLLLSLYLFTWDSGNCLLISLYVYIQRNICICEVIDNKADFDLDRFSSEGICYLTVLVGSYRQGLLLCIVSPWESGRVEVACQSISCAGFVSQVMRIYVKLKKSKLLCHMEYIFHLRLWNYIFVLISNLNPCSQGCAGTTSSWG